MANDVGKERLVIFGDVDFGPDSVWGVRRYFEEQLRWFDHWLRDESPNDAPSEPLTENEELEQFTSRFHEAVRLRLIADVPVGIFLSGGLDSSAVAAAVKEVHNTSLNTFSIAFHEGGQFDETRYAREVAEMLGTQHPRADEMDAYERLLGDAMEGDSALFAREDYVEEAWRIVDPARQASSRVSEYEPGTWGPKEVDQRVAPAGGWQNPVVNNDKAQ